MNIVFTVLAALPIGFLVRKRGLAVVTYLAAEALVFSFQTLDVLLNWMAGRNGLGGAKAFGPFPTAIPIDFKESEVYAYGVVNLMITLAGIGLTVLGTVVAGKRAARRAAASSPAGDSMPAGVA